MPAEFYLSLYWWILLLSACAAASVPAMLKQFRPLLLLPSAIIWIAATVTMSLMYTPAAAMTGGGISLLWGLFLLLLSLFFSGLKEMAKKRYRGL
jgi:hypothetical protein